jgi:hypothetical protein
MAIMTLKPVEEESAPLPPRDHNRPPPEELIPLEFREELLRDKPDFLTLMDNYLGVGDPNSEDWKDGAVHRAACTNEEELGKCGLLIKALRQIEQRIDATHTTVKAPYLLAGRLVDAEKNALTLRVKVGRQRVQGLMDDYAAEQLRKQRAEEARIAEERRKQEQERRELEALAKANNLEHALPPAPPPPPIEEARRPAPLRTDGATVSIGTEWDCEIEDYTKAFRKVKDDAKVREAVDAAIRRIVKATKGATVIPGVRQFERAKTSAR